jgi:Flp pilus assembly pilin Flp
MRKLLAAVKRLVQGNEGHSWVEYGLVIALLSVVCLAALDLLGTTIESLFSQLASYLSTVGN